MIKLQRSLWLVLIYICLSACQPEASQDKRYVLIQGIDSAGNPGDNFFRYVNGKWYDSAEIPSTQAGVGSYRFLNYPQRIRLQNILDSISISENPEGSIARLVGDFYASGMDTAAINARGYEPIVPVLTRIDQINDLPMLMTFVAEETKVYNNSLLSIYVSPDDKNSKMNIAHVSQTGLGLPNRDYYFNTDESTLGIQQAYKKYLTSLFVLIGTDSVEASENAEITYNIDKQIAGSHKTRVELRDVKANYNKMTVSTLEERHPNIGWRALLGTLGTETDSIDVSQPAYYAKFNELLKTIPLGQWKVYLKANTLSNYADNLSTAFVDTQFEFDKVISGQSVQKPRGEMMANQVDNLLGEALGQIYVKKYFPESAKVRMEELVDNFEKAYAIRIDKLDWMSDSTKQKAKEKLEAMSRKIGYPDQWKDYSKVKVERDKYFENVVSAKRNLYGYNLAKLGQPVDKKEWFTTPSTVTAYNNPTANEIVFPAGILQPPYFDNEADDALNYGGIGIVIGHEIVHTFDDQGAQFDKEGNVNNWWTDEDYEKFKARTQQVIDLYSTFTVLDSLYVKGDMTVGENTADLSGVAVAYDAFKMTKQGQDTTRIGGFTPDQRFFLSIANIWRVKMKDEYLRLWLNTNSHAPPMWRVNGPLMNTPAFYEAFDIKPGDKMYLPEEERITIW